MDGYEGVRNKMKDLRNEYLRKDEEKLMKAIHENHKDALMDYQINSQLKEIARKESKSYCW